MEVLTVPNLLTLLRMALAPVFLLLYASGRARSALPVFAVAAATDVLDGLAARVLGQRTRLGAVLDPVADKLLFACALFALAARGQLIPWWLPILVVSRDAAQLAGAAGLRSLLRPVPVAPTRIGKYASFALAGTVLVALAPEYGAIAPARAAPFAAALGLVAAECVALSAVQYSLYFARTLRLPPSAPAEPR